MAVFVELTIDSFQEAFQKHVDGARGSGRRGGAGEANVRRPLRGIEIKDDTYAVVRVIQANGEPLELFDSSSESGTSSSYANFLLQSVQEVRMEKSQIVDTFGEPYIFFFGEAPRFLDCQAVLLNSLDFNWKAEWWENYDRYLRGTRLVEQGARCYLFYDENIVEGYMLQAQAVEQSEYPYAVQLSFRFFVTNYANISLIGDPFYPVRAATEVPYGVDLTSADAVARLTPKQKGVYPEPGVMASEVYTAYLKQVGAVQIQQQIEHAQSLEQAHRLQRQYALQQLGLPGASLEGSLADIGKGLLQGIKQGTPTDVARAVREVVEAEGQRALEDLKQQFNSQFGELLGGSPGGGYNLADVLRQSLLYSTPYPGQNIDAFLRNASMHTFKAPQPPPELQRIFPLRSKISDNYDEYTRPHAGSGLTESDYALNQLWERGIGNAGYNPPTPQEQIDKELCKLGAQTEAATYYAFGLIDWSPRDGFSAKSGSGKGTLPDGLGGDSFSGAGGSSGYGGTGRGPVVVNAGYLPTGSYSLTLGNKGFTPSVGGAHGGALGGASRAGVAGASREMLDSVGLGFLPSEAAAKEGADAYQFTAGIRPDGSAYSHFGRAEDEDFGAGGSAIFGGGANIAAVASFGAGIRGTGAFGIQALSGRLGSPSAGGASCKDSGRVVNNQPAEKLAPGSEDLRPGD